MASRRERNAGELEDGEVEVPDDVPQLDVFTTDGLPVLRQIVKIQYSRLNVKTGRHETIPERFEAPTMSTLAEVFERWGGGDYHVAGFTQTNQFVRKNRFVLGGPSKPISSYQPTEEPPFAAMRGSNGGGEGITHLLSQLLARLGRSPEEELLEKLSQVLGGGRRNEASGESAMLRVMLENQSMMMKAMFDATTQRALAPLPGNDLLPLLLKAILEGRSGSSLGELAAVMEVMQKHNPPQLPAATPAVDQIRGAINTLKELGIPFEIGGKPATEVAEKGLSITDGIEILVAGIEAFGKANAALKGAAPVAPQVTDTTVVQVHPAAAEPATTAAAPVHAQPPHN